MYPTVVQYRSFVRPLLESSAPAWNPTKRGDVNVLENVQRRSLRLIGNLKATSYDDKLKELGLQSLEDRRIRGDQIETFKYLHGYNDADPHRLFTFVRDRHAKDTRSYASNNLVPEKTSLNIRKYFYSNRVIGTWNDLPAEVKESVSINSFKNNYDRHINFV